MSSINGEQLFNYNFCLDRLNSITPKESSEEKVRQAIKFINEEIFDKRGAATVEYKLFIEENVYKHFSIDPKDTHGELIKEHYTEKIKQVKKEINKNRGKEDNAEVDKPKSESIDFDEEEVSEEAQIIAKEKAMEILKEGKVIDKILSTVKKTHVGDEKFEELLTLAVASQSCTNTAGIQPAVHGPPGSGKSHGVKSHLHLIRAKHKLESSMSAKAAYYANLKPGCILFSDDTQALKELGDTLKRATTCFQEKTIYSTVNGDREGASLIIPERIIWLFTSVDSETSDQVDDRQFKCNTKDTVEQKRAACAKGSLRNNLSNT